MPKLARFRNVRVLMLGWEYPPRFAGGLGKACQGLSQAMAKQGAQIFFVLPTFPDRVIERRLEVVGAREALIEAGWDPEEIEQISVSSAFAGPAGAGMNRPLGGFASQQRTGDASASVTSIRSEAVLSPYGASPDGPIPKRILSFFESYSAEVSETQASGARSRLRAVRSGAGSRPVNAGSSGASGAAGAGAGPANSSAQGQGAKAKAGGEIYGRNLWSEIEKYAFTVRKMAETHEVDCVHAHDWMTFPAAFEFQRITGAPVFLHVHATEYDRSGESVNNDVFRIEREGFLRATHIFAVSRYTAGIIERLYGVPKRKISVVYNAPEDQAKHFIASPTTEREPQVVFLGRLTFQKGPDHFMRAAAVVAKLNPEAKFIYCGVGDMMDQLRAQAHRLGIEHRVHFAGFVDPSGVDQILKNSKVLVMPSVSEPFGLVALEAIHCGIPVILSKQSGVREVLPRALQVDFWDHEKLADQILAALRLPELSEQLVNDGMELIQQLSWEKSAQKVLRGYREHLGSTYFEAVEGAHGH